MNEPRLRWEKVKGGSLWHARSFKGGVLLGFVRRGFDQWDAVMTIPGKRWPNNVKNVNFRDQDKGFHAAKRSVEESVLGPLMDPGTSDAKAPNPQP